MKKMKRVMAGVAMLISGASFAAGFQLYSEGSAEALGVAGAVIGRQGMTSQAWYNPAATSSFEKPSFMAGFSALKLSSEYSYAGGSSELVDDWRPTGYFYTIFPLDEKFTLNLSINAPYGMITQWESDWVGQYIATYTNARFLYMTPSLTYRVNDELSIAAGFNIVYGSAELHKYIPPYPVHPAFPMYGIGAKTFAKNKVSLSADGFGVGFTGSVHYQPTEDWGFGAHYQSRVRLHLKGESKFRYEEDYQVPLPGGPLVGYRDGDADTYVTLPSSLGVGVANNSFKDWTLTFDTVWTEWSTYDDLDVHFDHYPVLRTPKTSFKNNKWDDVFSFRVGAEYQLNDNWALRGGYMYDISPANDRWRAPEMPDNDRHMFSLGCGYTKDNWGIDLAYAYLFLEDGKLGTEVAKTPGYTGGRGSFETDVHIVSLAVRYQF